MEENIPASKLCAGDHNLSCSFNLGLPFRFAAAVWPFHGHCSPSVIYCLAVDAYEVLVLLRGGGAFGVRWKESGTAWAVGLRAIIC